MATETGRPGRQRKKKPVLAESTSIKSSVPDGLMHPIVAGIDTLRTSVIGLIAGRNGAYQERAHVLAALSKCFPAHLTRHDEGDLAWDNDWRTIVCVHFPVGQGCWHIHDSELSLFTHLKVEENHWDGHTTKEKYDRLRTLPVQVSSSDKNARIKAALQAVEKFLD